MSVREQSGQAAAMGRRIVAVALPATLVVAGLGTVLAWTNYRSAGDRERRHLESLAAAAAGNLADVLDNRFQILESIGSLRAFRTADRSAIAGDIRAVDAPARGFTGGMGWVDDRGRAKAGRRRVSLADRAYVRRALGGAARSVEAVIGRASGRPVLVLAVPTRGGGGRVNGVLTGAFRIGTLERIAPGLTTPDAELRVIDAQGRILAGAASSSAILRVDGRSPYARMREREQGVIDAPVGLTGAPDRVIGYATIAPAGWLVALSRPRSAVVGPSRRAFLTELAIIGVAALFVLLSVLLGVRAVHRRQREDERRRLGAERLRAVAAELIATATARDVGEIVCTAVRAETGSGWCAVIQEPHGPGDIAELLETDGEVAFDPALLRFDRVAGRPPGVVADEDRRWLDPAGVLAADGAPMLAATLGTRPGARRFLLAAGDPAAVPDAAAVDAFATIAGDAEQAYQRAELMERDRRVRTHAELFAAAGLGADAGADLDARAEQLVDALVPRFADFATVEVDAPSGEPAVIAARHADPELLPALRRLREDHGRAATSAVDLASLFGDGQPQLVAGGEHPPASGAASTDLDARLAPTSHIGVPLRSGDRVVAGLILGRDRRSEPFDDADLTFAASMAERASVAIARARLFDQQRHVALELQQSLLNDHPDSFGDQVRVASRYRPAERNLQVGGDWYDAIELSDGQIGLAVGDVVGHGLRAAAAMGKLASALRAIAITEADPHEVLRRLDAFAALTEGAALATVAYAVLDPRAGTLRYAAAGHPPPLVVGPDGAAAFLWGARGAPLALADGVPRTSAERKLTTGATVLLYSDGVFERRGEPVDASLDRLARIAGRGADAGDPKALVDRTLAELLEGRPRSDDVAMLAARLDVIGRRLLRKLPAMPSELAAMRSAARIWLNGSPAMSGDRVQDALLALSEAAANAVEHAYTQDARGAIEIDLRETGGEIVMQVRDFGHWRHPAAPGPRGRGMGIMRQLVDELAVHSDGLGTTVSMRLDVAGQPSEVTAAGPAPAS